MKRWKKSVWGILLSTLLLLGSPAAAFATVPLETSADSVVLMDPTSGAVLFEKNPHKKVAPASTTKLMTLLVAFDAINQGRVSMDDRVTTSQRAFEMGGSQIYLEPGEEMPLETMLISIAVQSANDACVAVAEHISGSYEAYVEEMNKKAQELGMKNTNFVNPHGLPAENHYTSAYDMALVAREALKYPKLREMVSIRHYKIREESDKPMQLDNHNKLLWWYPGTDGFKTGWTNEAKYCLVSTVERDNLRLIASVFGVPEMRGHFKETMKVYNYGFARYGFKLVAQPDQALGQVPVGKGTVDQVALIPKEKPGIVVEKGKDKGITSSMEVLPYVDAPVEAGQKLGELIILQDSQEKKRIDLIAQEAVMRGTFDHQLFKIFRGMYGFQ
ncbi:D-alanyl-D-alanine carboxypeptidase family protein [Heliorestis convoluta]|uniref:serine-type D-Ala-D-Ala carboxypeptidase n=1 Tax=Heliorestis convoluta TaxID=356322 RepID=A0A5Q2MXF0_9FIRM|nr:D-alanyl-D-alanine carboxypeptidase family protein [Heliorestis convoluta]QGG46521.1 D-alanyl-D-alanine carboxypeptidase [Heliorestis convoluta]